MEMFLRGQKGARSRSVASPIRQTNTRSQREPLPVPVIPVKHWETSDDQSGIQKREEAGNVVAQTHLSAPPPDL